jgi:hypothetical protein
MLYLIGGVAILCGMLLLVYLFVNTDSVRLARTLKWTAIGIAIVALAALTVSGRLFVLLAPLSMLLPFLGRLRSWFDRHRPPTGGQSSTVTTDFLRMTLDHDTGTMTGTVLSGHYTGMHLDELGVTELLALLRECRAADERAARLLEAYLDRVHPAWRDEMAGEHGAAGAGPRRGGDMTAEEAYRVLGLAAGASPEQIREAHHRLMKKLHPDAGGSDYLATQINRARDVLLHGS